MHHIGKGGVRPAQAAVGRGVDLDALCARLLPHLRRDGAFIAHRRALVVRAADGGGAGEEGSDAGGALLIGAGIAAEKVGAEGVILGLVDGVRDHGGDAA